MNEPDLKFLAERAAGLGDRTAERLAGVHGRIETARRRRRAVAAAGAAFVVVAVVVGLTVLDHVPGRDTPGPAPKPTPTPFNQVGSLPKAGTCWAVPAASVVDQKYWFDDSRQVPCTEPHTTETVIAFPLPEATIAQAEKSLQSMTCGDDVRVYLGIDDASWVPWRWVSLLPSKEEVADGASWVRCDAYFPTTTDGISPRTTTVSAEGIGAAPPVDFWACTDQPPDEHDQPFVSCDRPHRYEQTGRLAILHSITAYPSPAELSTEARRQCRDGVPPGHDGIAVDAVWDPPSNFEAGTQLAGWCYMFYPDGQALPAR